MNKIKQTYRSLVNVLTGELTDENDMERGSESLDKVIWAVGIAVVSLIAVGAVVASINGKIGELPF